TNYAILSLFGAVLTVGYANCSKPFRTNALSGSDFMSLSVCEETLRASFNVTYRPLLTTAGMCLNCHNDSGNSPYKFASSNLSKGFSAFQQVGVNRIDANAVSSTHATGNTGPQNQASFTSARASYDVAYASFQNCQSSGGGGGPTPGGPAGAMIMDEKNFPEIYFEGKVGNPYWALFSEVTPVPARLPAYFSATISVKYETVGGLKVAKGYTIKDPRVEMLAGEIELEMEGLVLYVNGEQPPGLEQLLSARKTIRGIGPNYIYQGEVYVPMESISSSDKISFAFGYAETRARTDSPPTPATPTVKSRAVYTRDADIEVEIGNNSTAKRYCLTTSSAKPTSVANVCPGYENSTVSGWVNTAPASLNLVTLGYVPTNGSTIQFYLWVANSDLKISAAAGTGSVLYDVEAPAKIAFGSVTLGDTQIATLNGVGDSSEPITWCVKEATTIRDAQDRGGCRSYTEKPVYVALTQKGTRYVVIHIQDRAGNQGLASDVKTVENTFDRISFAQLSMAGDARGVFANRCLSCHGAGKPAQAKWDATSYSSTVSKGGTRTSPGVLRLRIENATMPMPASGLIPLKERELIHLWFTQTNTPVEI
ncbi:MAG: hypothetical protein V4692_04655, partial [Bdellovibrionota bacterium]